MKSSARYISIEKNSEVSKGKFQASHILDEG